MHWRTLISSIIKKFELCFPYKSRCPENQIWLSLSIFWYNFQLLQKLHIRQINLNPTDLTSLARKYSAVRQLIDSSSPFQSGSMSYSNMQWIVMKLFHTKMTCCPRKTPEFRGEICFTWFPASCSLQIRAYFPYSTLHKTFAIIWIVHVFPR